ncbi:MAG TPA: PEGA domain-containing protein, partial [Chroococcales cyanobacterium]
MEMLKMLKRLGFCFFLVLAAYRQAWAGEIGSIKVTANLFNSKVFLDDNFRGTAPLVIEEVPFGPHLLRLESEGCETFTGKYEVSSSEPLLVKAVLRPQLNGILILNPAEGNEPPSKKIPITAFLAGGTFLEGYWGLLGIGAKVWS